MTDLATKRIATAILTSEEGYVRHAYKDHLGYLTIGYGTMIDVRRGGGISKPQARMLLDQSENEAIDALEDLVFWKDLNAARRAVLVSMVYQMGFSGVMAFRRMRAALRAGDYDTAAEEMLDSDWYREDTPDRAERHAEIMRLGELSPELEARYETGEGAADD